MPLLGNVLFVKEIRRTVCWFQSLLGLIEFTLETRELFTSTTSWSVLRMWNCFS